MFVAPDLLDILVCPQCHATLFADESARELVCNGCALAYGVTGDGIPNMLVEEARRLD